MKTNIILWFFGQSAAGKATLIRKLAKNSPPHLIEALNLRDFHLRVCEESLTGLEDEQRPRLPDLIHSQTENASNLALLVKGQEIDLTKGLVHAVKRRVNSCSHRIIFVWSDIEKVQRRWRERGKEWDLPVSKCRNEAKTQLLLVGKLRADFDLLCVDATNWQYRIRDWPSER